MRNIERVSQDNRHYTSAELNKKSVIPTHDDDDDDLIEKAGKQNLNKERKPLTESARFVI